MEINKYLLYGIFAIILIAAMAITYIKSSNNTKIYVSSGVGIIVLIVEIIIYVLLVSNQMIV